MNYRMGVAAADQKSFDSEGARVLAPPCSITKQSQGMSSTEEDSSSPIRRGRTSSHPAVATMSSETSEDGTHRNPRSTASEGLSHNDCQPQKHPVLAACTTSVNVAMLRALR
ncbi:MAG: hypothetical protein EOO65_03025 [Methanosarcinales archaeon]|nr:MAG: hypothetical protein EOO65_03025 [Methanosarcinales archaeon]